MVARGRGCSQEWALRIYDAAGVSHLLYALPFVALNKTNWKKIETDHTAAIRLCLGLPRSSRVAATLTEGKAWPAQLRVQQAGLNYIDRLSRAPDGAALLRRLQSRTLTVAGKLAAAHKDLTGQAQPPPATDPLPPHRASNINIRIGLPGVGGKRRDPPQALRFSALETIASGGAETYTDGSVLPGPPASAAAACVAPQMNMAKQCRLPFPASTTTAEIAGLHLAADLAVDLRPPRVTIFCDSKAALQRLQQPHKHAPTVAALHAKLTRLASGGSEVCVQWLPAHVGIAGNEAADRLAKAAHTEDTPTTAAVNRIDEARFLITEVMLGKHPDERVAARNAPARIPRKFGRQEAALLSRLRTGCAATNARLQLYRKRDSPACPHCGLYESTAHCLTACAAYNSERGRLQQAYARLGVACSTKEDMLFPRCHRILLADALQHLLTYLDETGLAARL
ncbi:uncharacterized protein LOC144172963 [Haemaphysalis longicornis]